MNNKRKMKKKKNNNGCIFYQQQSQKIVLRVLKMLENCSLNELNLRERHNYLMNYSSETNKQIRKSLQ
jgi:hypothetical protein